MLCTLAISSPHLVNYVFYYKEYFIKSKPKKVNFENLLLVSLKIIFYQEKTYGFSGVPFPPVIVTPDLR